MKSFIPLRNRVLYGALLIIAGILIGGCGQDATPNVEVNLISHVIEGPSGLQLARVRLDDILPLDDGLIQRFVLDLSAPGGKRRYDFIAFTVSIEPLNLESRQPYTMGVQSIVDGRVHDSAEMQWSPDELALGAAEEARTKQIALRISWEEKTADAFVREYNSVYETKRDVFWKEQAKKLSAGELNVMPDEYVLPQADQQEIFDRHFSLLFSANTDAASR